MANEFSVISDGTFILSDSENKNQFYFYRNDRKVLTDTDKEPLEKYQTCIMEKMMDEETTDMTIGNIYSENSDDGKRIKLTICDNGKVPQNFLEHLFYKILG